MEEKKDNINSSTSQRINSARSMTAELIGDFRKNNDIMFRVLHFEGAVMLKLPVTTISVDVEEQVMEDYEMLEYFVLKFYSLGYREPETIANILGIDADMVRRLLKNEKEMYAHIDIATGEVTEFGQKTLARNDNASTDGNYVSVSRYKSRRKMKVDAVTGTVIPRYMDEHRNIFGISLDDETTIPPLGAIEITDALRDDIRDRMSEYKNKDYIEVSDIICEYGEMTADGLSYYVVPLLKFRELHHPFIIMKSRRRFSNMGIRSKAAENIDDEAIPRILSLSERDAIVFLKHGLSTDDILVKPDSSFMYLDQQTAAIVFDLNENGKEIKV